MHRYRLHIPPEQIAPADQLGSATARLDGDEFHYCVHVLRRTEGSILVFDGVAHEWEATITHVKRAHATLRLDRLVREETPPGLRLVACPALLKGHSLDEVVELATELGIQTIAPIVTKRCDAQTTKGDGDKRLARWRRVALAATRQSNRIALPEILSPTPLAERLQSLDAATKLICAVGNNHEPLLRAIETAMPPAGEIALFVGPEADFTDEEVAFAIQAGARPVRLGTTTLRAPVAMAYGLSVLSASLAAR